jgi:hypothetical protein
MSRVALGSITISDINDGLLGARGVTRYLYRETQSDTAPSAPSGTLTWSTGVLSGVTAGWSEEAPQVDATGTGRPWVSVLNFYQASSTSQSATTQVTGSTPVKGFTFDGIVTFTDSNLTDGTSTYDPASVINNGSTTINGSTITTGTIEANRIDSASGTFNTANIPNLNADKITAGTIAAARLDADTITSKVLSVDWAKITNVEVETLQIGENQVTVPDSSYTSGSVTLQTQTAEYDVQSLTFTCSGQPVQINFCCGLELYIGFGSGVNVEFNLYRGTTLLETFVGSEGQEQMETSVSIAYLDENPPSGSVTYTVKAKRTTGQNAYVRRRSLTTLEVKR